MREIKYTRPQINNTKSLPHPNAYALALNNEYAEYAFDEESAPQNKGQWHSHIFKKPLSSPIDLEIGTGAGNHFAHHCLKHPERLLLGIELKYKPLIQSIRRALDQGSQNGKIIRYHAYNIEDLFAENELDNVYIHFPDPWTHPNKPRHRIVNRHFLKKLHQIQKPGSAIEFKTDSRQYFLWAEDEIANSPYEVEVKTYNLHATPLIEKNFTTQFERIFTKQNIEINYVLLRKN